MTFAAVHPPSLLLEHTGPILLVSIFELEENVRLRMQPWFSERENSHRPARELQKPSRPEAKRKDRRYAA